jgi:hypothetical protein
MADSSAKPKAPFDADVEKWIKGLQALKDPASGLDKFLEDLKALFLHKVAQDRNSLR